MTQKELNLYKELNKKFQDKCSEVADLLEKLEPNFKHLDIYELVGDTVFGKGNEYWGCGGHEEHCETFSAEYLCMDRDKLIKLIEEQIQEKARKQQKLKEDRQNAELILKRAQYEKLRKELKIED